MKSALTHNLDIVASNAVRWLSYGATIEALSGEMEGVEVELNSPEELELFVKSVSLEVEKALRGHKTSLMPISKEILKNLR